MDQQQQKLEQNQEYEYQLKEQQRTTKPMLRWGSFNVSEEKGGEGCGGVVWKAVRRSNAQVCAIKILKAPINDLVDKDGDLPEAAIMECINHLGVPQYYGWGIIYKDELVRKKQEKYCCFNEDVGAFIVMEWVEGVTLEKKVGDISFGKRKRRHIYKQLLEVLVYLIYLQTKRISHGGLYLNNIIIASKTSNGMPRLILCDFGAATVVPEDPVAVKISDTKLDRDRCQCGMKDAFDLARDLIDVRKPVSLEAALSNPFFTNDICEATFTTPATPWNDETVENIAAHLIRTGNTQDFINASLVCKQLNTALQRTFLCTPQFKESVQPLAYDKKEISETAPVDMFSMWMQRVFDSPFLLSWSHLQSYSDSDHLFELEIIDNCVESVLVHLVEIQSSVWNMTFENQQWSSIYCRFHDIKGPSSYTGIWNMRILAWLARDRTKQLINLTLDQFEIEKKLYIRMVALMKDLLYDFNKKAKNYLREHGLELPLRLWY